jgi:hypothetical protein
LIDGWIPGFVSLSKRHGMIIEWFLKILNREVLGNIFHGLTLMALLVKTRYSYTTIDRKYIGDREKISHIIMYS